MLSNVINWIGKRKVMLFTSFEKNATLVSFGSGKVLKQAGLSMGFGGV